MRLYDGAISPRFPCAQAGAEQLRREDSRLRNVEGISSEAVEQLRMSEKRAGKMKDESEENSLEEKLAEEAADVARPTISQCYRVKRLNEE